MLYIYPLCNNAGESTHPEGVWISIEFVWETVKLFQNKLWTLAKYYDFKLKRSIV